MNSVGPLSAGGTEWWSRRPRPARRRSPIRRGHRL